MDFREPTSTGSGVTKLKVPPFFLTAFTFPSSDESWVSSYY